MVGTAVILVVAFAGFWTIRSAGASSLGAKIEPSVGAEALDVLEGRIAALESRLGLGSERLIEGGFRDRYEALVSWEAQLAEVADSALRFVPSISPIEDGYVTSGYGRSRLHPVLNSVRPHHGLDIAAPLGTPVRAMAAGRIKNRFRSPDYGLGIDVEHGQDEGNGYVTRYAHLSAIEVERYAVVEKGEVIGRVGQTGLVSGPSLHLEVYFQGRARDPGLFLPNETGVALP